MSPDTTGLPMGANVCDNISLSALVSFVETCVFGSGVVVALVDDGDTVDRFR